MAGLVDPYDSPDHDPWASGRAAPSRGQSKLIDPYDTTQERKSFAERAKEMSDMALSVERTKNTEFGSYLREEAKRPREGEDEAARFKRLYGGLTQAARPGTGEGMIRAGQQGLTFGAGDELNAAVAAALDTDTGLPFSERYGQNLSRERERLGQFREDSPIAAYGTEIAGAIPTAIATSPASAAASLGGKMFFGGVTGGVQGSVYGGLSGEGGAMNRAQNALQTGLIGAGIGAAAPVVTTTVGKIADTVRGARQANALGVPATAARQVAKVAEADQALTGTGAQRIARGGSGAMLADAGPSTRNLLDAAIQSGPAASKARAAVDSRVATAARNVTQAFDDFLGRPQGVRKTARGIAQSTSAARGAAYDAAYAKPIDYASNSGRAVEDVLSRIPPRVMQQAVSEANEDMVSQGLKNMQIMAQVGDDGAVVFKEMPNVQQLDMIKRALQTLGKETDQFGRATAGGTRAKRLAAALREALNDAVPEYSDATAKGADKIAMDQALDLGRQLLRSNMTRELVEEGLAGAGPAERTSAANGLRYAIDEIMANTKRTMSDPQATPQAVNEAAAAFRTIMSRANMEKVQTLLGDDAAGRLFERLDEALSAFELKASVVDNSKTAIRTALQKEVKADVASGVTAAARRGEIGGTLKGVWQNFAGGTPEAEAARADEVFNAISEVLTDPRGQAALQRWQAMQALPNRTGAPPMLTDILRAAPGASGALSQALLPTK